MQQPLYTQDHHIHRQQNFGENLLTSNVNQDHLISNRNIEFS